MMPVGEGIIDEADIRELERLSERLPYEWVEVGDAGEPNRVGVGRFMIDVEEPQLVNRPSSERALKVVSKPEYMARYCALLDADQLYIRRMQVNCLEPGGFVGMHLDTDSNPDYRAAVVLQFGRDFEGGEYAIYDGDQVKWEQKPPHYSTIVSQSEFPHEVRTVVSGHRTALVFFLSEHGGKNRRDHIQGE